MNRNDLFIFAENHSCNKIIEKNRSKLYFNLKQQQNLFIVEITELGIVTRHVILTLKTSRHRTNNSALKSNKLTVVYTEYKPSKLLQTKLTNKSRRPLHWP